MSPLRPSACQALHVCCHVLSPAARHAVADGRLHAAALPRRTRTEAAEAAGLPRRAGAEAAAAAGLPTRPGPVAAEAAAAAALPGPLAEGSPFDTDVAIAAAKSALLWPFATPAASARLAADVGAAAALAGASFARQAVKQSMSRP